MCTAAYSLHRLEDRRREVDVFVANPRFNLHYFSIYLYLMTL